MKGFFRSRGAGLSTTLMLAEMCGLPSHGQSSRPVSACSLGGGAWPLAGATATLAQSCNESSGPRSLVSPSCAEPAVSHPSPTHTAHLSSGLLLATGAWPPQQGRHRAGLSQALTSHTAGAFLGLATPQPAPPSPSAQQISGVNRKDLLAV